MPGATRGELEDFLTVKADSWVQPVILDSQIRWFNPQIWENSSWFLNYFQAFIIIFF